MGTLYYGDNLAILRNRDYFPRETVDLVCPDPPFNSNASYNVLFKAPDVFKRAKREMKGTQEKLL